MTLLVTFPAWGDYVERAKHTTIRSLHASWQACGYPPMRFIIHTDRPDDLVASLVPWRLWGCVAETRPLPPNQTSKYNIFAECHHDGLMAAVDGEIVIPTSADVIFSVETLRYILDCRRPMIGILGPRCRADGEELPIGVTGDVLARWRRRHLHPVMYQFFWGPAPGRAKHPSAVYWADENSLVAHAFHIHPIAVKKDRSWNSLNPRSTVDVGLPHLYMRHEIEFADHYDKMVAAEISGPMSVETSPRDLDAEAIAAWTRQYHQPITARHRWFFNQRLILDGTGEGLSDMEDVAKVNRLLDGAP